MPKAHPGLTSFNAGELSPLVDGRFDIAKYPNGCKILENMVATIQGPATKRPGTKYVRDILDSEFLEQLVPFQFSRTQSYVLSMRAGVMVPHYNGSPVLGAPIAITAPGISQANPGVVTATAHGLNNEDQVFISGVGGMVEANGNFFTVKNRNINDFELSFINGDGSGLIDINTTGWAAWTAGGTIQRVVEIPVPYQTFGAEMSKLRWAQSADVLYLAHPDAPRYRLERYAHDEWQFVEVRGAVLESAYSITAITTASPAVVTTATAHGYAAGDTVFLSRILRPMQSLAGQYFRVGAVTATTFELLIELTGVNVNTSSFSPFSSAGSPQVKRVSWFAFPPFVLENLNKESRITASAEDMGTSVSLFSTGGEFVAGDVGSDFKIREIPGEQHPPWAAVTDFTDWKAGGISVGEFSHYEGNVYELTSKTGPKTGTQPPVHTDPGEIVADAQFSWEFAHSGSGFVQIRSVVSAYEATGRIIRRLPQSAVDTSGKQTIIAPVTNASPCSVTVTAHPYATGDRILIFGVTGMTELNGRVFTITKTGAGTFTLDGIDSTLFGVFAGTASAVRVSNITTAQAATNRWSRGAFSPTFGYPRAVTFYEDRLIWAGSAQQPQTLWHSVTGDYENHATLPTDDSALTFTINADQVNAIEWLYPGKSLFIGTIGSEFVATGTAADKPLGLSNPLRPVRMTGHGSRADLMPVSVGNRVVFVQRAGRKVRELVYDFESDAYQGPDLALLADHLTTTSQLFGRIQYASEPHSVIWCVRSDGTLLGLTYDPIQQVVGWHRHPIAGASGQVVTVEQVAVIPHPDGDEDQVWLIVKRVSGSVIRRSIEYLDKYWRDGDAISDAHFMDQGATYSGAPATKIYGLVHQEGKTLNVVADGVPVADVVVSNGTATLLAAASKVQLGYKVVSTLQTMRLEAGAEDGVAQGKTKRISRFVARLFQTATGLFYGYTNDITKMDPLTMTDEQDPSGAAVSLLTGDTRDLAWPGGFEQAAHLTLKHTEALPFTLVALLPRVTTEDR